MLSSSAKKFDRVKLLPHLMKMGEFLKRGFDHYVQMKAADVEVDPDLLSAFIEMQMDQWHPKIQGKNLLDPDTKSAGSRFLAGIIYNYVSPSSEDK